MHPSYPIKPRHLDTEKEPIGFNDLLPYDQLIILWAFVQFWQHKGTWERLEHEEFIKWISNYDAKVNSAVKCGIIWFVQSELKSILKCTEDTDKKIFRYELTHYLVSTYFHWNPKT